MSDDDKQQEQFAAALDALDGLDQWAVLLDMLDGFVAAAVARGYTQREARKLVIHSFTQAKT